jgi:recombination protein RecT
MTDNLPEQAKPKTATLKTMLTSDAMRHQFAAALPKHLSAERFTRVALTALTRTPKLNECTQASFFKCLLELSSFGLEPDGRRAHLIPYRNNKAGNTECTLIVDYKGLVELAMRSGLVSTIHADVVCENDVFEYNVGEITKHAIDWRKPRGQAYAAYAVCVFKDGTKKCEVMSTEEIESIRKRSRAGNAGPWVTDWNEMAKKTVFRRLSKWLPLSADFRDAVEKDDDVIDVVCQPSKTANLDNLADELCADQDVETVEEDLSNG